VSRIHLSLLAWLLSLTPHPAIEPTTNSIGMALVRIEPGTFTMGQDGPQTDYNIKNHSGESDRPDGVEEDIKTEKQGNAFLCLKIMRTYKPLTDRLI
jgi:formylglycine-generating enzyme required for sulfatase activity